MVFSLVACAPGLAGERLSDEDPLYGEAQALAADWILRDDLPSIWRPVCARYLRDMTIRVVALPPGVAGVTDWAGSDPVIYITDEPPLDGYPVLIRHETAHILAECSGLGVDDSHEIDAIWSTTDGVVWAGGQ